MISRRTLFAGLGALVAPVPAVATKAGLAPGHRSADPPVLVRVRDMANCKLFVMRREEWDRLWYDGRMMHIPEPD